MAEEGAGWVGGCGGETRDKQYLSLMNGSVLSVCCKSELTNSSGSENNNRKHFRIYTNKVISKQAETKHCL